MNSPKKGKSSGEIFSDFITELDKSEPKKSPKNSDQRTQDEENFKKKLINYRKRLQRIIPLSDVMITFKNNSENKKEYKKVDEASETYQDFGNLPETKNLLPPKPSTIIGKLKWHINKWWQSRQKWQKRVLKTFIIIVCLITLHTSVESLIPLQNNPVWGVSFSIKQTRSFGLDWHQTFIALLDDLQIKHVRLMSYWDEVEPQLGKFNFADLDWQLEQAGSRGVSVSLSIGLRQPRWPECHQPNWTANLSNSQWHDSLFEYIRVTTENYKSNNILQSWQLENEALNHGFGQCTNFDKQRLIDELALMKTIDRVHPVFMSLSDEHGLPIHSPKPDGYGLSVYQIYYNKTFLNGYATYPAPAWFHRIRIGLLKLLGHKTLFIHELQAEPWGPKPTNEMTDQEQSISLSPQQLKKNLLFGRKTGLKQIDLWGGEYWYWRKTVGNDDSYWNVIKNEITP